MYGTSQHVQSLPARRDRGGLPFLTLGVGLAVLAGIGYVTADVARAARGESAASGALEAKHLRSAAPRQPHLLLVTLDDVGWDDFGDESGELSALTPHLSKLAAGGVRLTNLYGQSLCTPARAALHTGKFVHRLGFTSLQMEAEITGFSNFSIPIRHRLLAQRLSEDAGYATAFVGKWNVGHCAEAYAPWNRGFDHFFGYFSSGVDYGTFEPDTARSFVSGGVEHTLRDLVRARAATGVVETGARWAGRNYTDALLAAAMASYARAHAAAHGARGRPFFAHLALHGPHDDTGAANAPDALLAPAGERGARAVEALGGLKRAGSRLRYAFGRALMAADGAFGEVLEAFTDAGLFDAGLIVAVASDNGGWPCGLNLRGSNAPLRGAKFSYHEGGVRVPGFVFASPSGSTAGLLPAASRGGSYAGLMHHVDWLATFVHLGGATTDDDAEIDSRSMWDALARADAAGAVSPREEVVFALDAHYFALRVGRYKLTRETINATWWGDLELDDDSPVMCIDGQPVSQLFDVVADPNERVDLFGLKEYEGVTRNITRRAVNLLETQSADLTWPFGAAKDFSLEYEAIATAFHDAGDYVVPWGCGVQ